MRRLIGGAVLACVLAACGSGSAQHGLLVKVDTNPFRVTLLQDGKPLVAEDKGARLRYQLNSTGDQFTLTKVLSSSGGVYQVATSEPGRTATVFVTRAPGTVQHLASLRLYEALPLSIPSPKLPTRSRNCCSAPRHARHRASAQSPAALQTYSKA